MAQDNESKMTMSNTEKPCAKWGLLLSQYVDETLDAGRAENVRRHIKECTDCASALAAFQTTRDAIRSVERQRLSSDFDQQLLDRIATIETQREAKRSATNWFPPTLRIGYGLTALAAAFVVVSVIHSPQGVKPVVRTANDSAFLTQCLAQHRSYAATQPLTDWSAQNLSARTDNQAGQSSDISGADSGMDTL